VQKRGGGSIQICRRKREMAAGEEDWWRWRKRREGWQ